MRILRNLPKRLQNPNRKGCPLFVNNGYVSNGIFLLKDSWLEKGFLASVAAQAEGEQPDFERALLDQEQLKDYKDCVVSSFLFEIEDGTKQRILYNDHCFAAINDDYLSFFETSKDQFLIKDKTNPVVVMNKCDTSKIDLMLMPMRFEEKSFTQIAEIIQVTQPREAVA